MLEFIFDSDVEMYKFMLYKIRDNEHKKQVIPQDMLGRTLAYNCFMPRLSNKELLYNTFAHRDKVNMALSISIKQLSDIISECSNQNNLNFKYEYEISSIFVNDICKTQENIVDFIGFLRRLTPAFIAYDSAIFDTYQILEMATAGADMIVINISYLRAYIVCMLVFKENPSILEMLNIDVFLQKLAQIKANKVLLQYHIKDLESMLVEHSNNLLEFCYTLGLIPLIYIQTQKDFELFRNKDMLNCIVADKYSLLPNETLNFMYKDSIQTSQENIDVVIEKFRDS